MRKALAIGFFSVALQAYQPAYAIGCLSGGAIGAVAGHQVHHGVMGAAGGCVAGHYAHKHAKQQAAQDKAAAAAKSSAPASASADSPSAASGPQPVGATRP